MEEQWQVNRAKLRSLRQEHPDWSYRQLTEATGCSRTWVKKWCHRFKTADPADQAILKSRSRRPINTGSPIPPAVVKRILTIRDHPPANLKRTPGPITIKYFLHQQEKEDPLDCYLPTSTSTIWRILDEHQRIIRPGQAEHEVTPPAEPLAEWQIDFKDINTVPPQPAGKKQHVVETLNVIDTGTSILVDNPARSDFNAETVILTMTDIFRQMGCPRQITFDRDPRFVASASSGDFPAPFVRFLACLGIKADICPPRRPDKNAYVERYNRTYKYEGILIYQPTSYDQVIEMNLDLRHHYNFERPNQARSCCNQPPRLAFPRLPNLPPIPETIDPDRWLERLDGKLFKRRVTHSGTVKVDKHRYYIGRAYHGRLVVLRVDAANQQFVVELNDKPIKTLEIKGLYHGQMSFTAYLDFISKQAISAWRSYLQKHRRYLPLAV